MAETRLIKTKIWSDDWFSDLSVDARYLYLYLLSNKNTHICGYYKTSLKEMEFMTGLTKKRLETAIKELRENMTYVEGWVILRNYPKHQNVSNNGKVQAAIERELANVPDSVLKSNSKSKSKSETMDSLPIGYQDTAQNIGGEDKDVDKSGDKDKKKYGEFKNVLLSDDEKTKLKARYGHGEAQKLVEELSTYIKSKGVRYKDHYATLLAWARKKNLQVQANGSPPKMIPEMQEDGTVRLIPNPEYHG